MVIEKKNQQILQFLCPLHGSTVYDKITVGPNLRFSDPNGTIGLLQEAGGQALKKELIWGHQALSVAG